MLLKKKTTQESKRIRSNKKATFGETHVGLTHVGFARLSAAPLALNPRARRGRKRTPVRAKVLSIFLADLGVPNFSGAGFLRAEFTLPHLKLGTPFRAPGKIGHAPNSEIESR